MKTYIRYLTAVFFLFAGIILWAPQTAEAADQTVTISSCKLNSSGTKVTVKAKVKKKTKEMGKKLYLVKLDAQSAESGTKSVKPIQSVKTKKGTVTFKVKFDRTMLYKKFVVACKKGGKYKYLSAPRYITNPEALATYKGKGPKAASKKGLQVEELSDSLEVGTQHAVVNWTLNSILNNNAVNKTAYSYRGKTYYLDADQIRRNDELVQAYNAAGVRVTVILLLPKDAASAGTSAMQYGGYSYTKFSSVKTSTKTGCRTFEAVMTYLAEHYGTKQNLVCGWILGNEINSAVVWNYGGGKSLSSYIKNYARSFRICYNAVKSVNKYANVYASVDYNWNRDIDGKKNSYFSSKAVLDQLYKRLKEQGNITFQIAYHAYPQGLTDPVFWDDSQATNSSKANIINFKNLDVLTKYIKKNYGKKYTVMLSEQSFNTIRGEAVQAAAYAYAYYISECNSMIEAFIYGREFDHPEEMNSGYYWGLCDSSHGKRLLWSVFQYIDTRDSFRFTDPLVKYTNISKWTKISGLKRSKFTSRPTSRQKGQILSAECISTSSITLTWEKMNRGDGYEIIRNGTVIAVIPGNSNVSYLDSGLLAGTTCSYQVRMYKDAPDPKDAAKRVRLYGSRSPAVSVVVSAGKVNLDEKKCKVDGSQIKVAWEKEPNVSGYEISRSQQADGNYFPIAVVDASKSSYTDSQTISGVTYYYKVRAFVTASGINYYGAYSESTAKQALLQLTAVVADGKVQLNWTKWPDTGSYYISCKPEAQEGYKWLETVDGYEHSTKKYRNVAGDRVEFLEGETYLFRVQPYYGKDAAGKDIKGEYSNVFRLTFQTAADPVGIPQGVVTGEDPETTDAAESEESTESTENTDGTESAESTKQPLEPESADTIPAETDTESTEAVDNMEDIRQTADTEAADESIPETADTETAEETITDTEQSAADAGQSPEERTVPEMPDN